MDVYFTHKGLTGHIEDDHGQFSIHLEQATLTGEQVQILIFALQEALKPLPEGYDPVKQFSKVQ